MLPLEAAEAAAAAAAILLRFSMASFMVCEKRSASSLD